MRIQHNIMAMSSYRNYTNNVSAMKKNLEKLSSGYKINRAGDDAAGLAISEKMRAQITGLKQAQANAKSGINLVQTAEGALQEVQDMLNRMVKLAEQSANGTYKDEVDREQLDKEFTKLKDEINRINNTANFNGIKLFGNGGAGDDDTTTDDDALTAADITAPTATTAALEDGDAGTSKTANTSFDFAGVKFAKDGQVQVSFGGKNYAVTVTKDMTADKFAEEFVKEYNKDKLKDAAAGEFTAAVDGTTKSKVVFTAGTANTAMTTAQLKTDLAKAPTIGPVTAVKEDDAAGTAAKAEIALTWDGGTAPTWQTGSKVEISTVGSGSPKANDLSLVATYGADSKWTVTGMPTGYSATFDGTKLTLTADAAGKKDLTTASFGAVSVSAKVDGTNDDTKSHTGALTFTDGTDADDGNDTDTDTDTTAGGGIKLQIGDTAATGNQITVTIKSISTDAIKDISEGTKKTLKELDVKTQSAALTAVDALKGMVNYISDIRGELGATQNRLDHTINNLSVMEENIQDAESTIRDTDIAEEMMAYTKNNILIQSAQAMLAQANQVPQGVLQLLQ